MIRYDKIDLRDREALKRAVERLKNTGIPEDKAEEMAFSGYIQSLETSNYSFGTTDDTILDAIGQDVLAGVQNVEGSKGINDVHLAMNDFYSGPLPTDAPSSGGGFGAGAIGSTAKDLLNIRPQAERMGRLARMDNARGLARDAHMATMMSQNIMDDDNAFEDAAKAAAWHFADSATGGLIGGIGWALKKAGVTDENFWTEGDAESWKNTHTTAGNIAKWTGMLTGMFTPSAPLKLLKGGTKLAKGAQKLAIKATSKGDDLLKLNQKLAKVEKSGALAKLEKGLDKVAKGVENTEGKVTPWAAISQDALFNMARVQGGKGLRRLWGVNRAAGVKTTTKAISKILNETAQRNGVKVISDKTIGKGVDKALERVAMKRGVTKGVHVQKDILKSLSDDAYETFVQQMTKELQGNLTSEAAQQTALRLFDDGVKEAFDEVLRGKATKGLGEIWAGKSTGKFGSFKELLGRGTEMTVETAAGMVVSGTADRFFHALAEPQLYMGESFDGTHWAEDFKAAAKYAVTGADGSSWREGLAGDLVAGAIFGTGAGLKLLPIPLLQKHSSGIKGAARSFQRILGGNAQEWEPLVRDTDKVINEVLSTIPRQGRGLNVFKWYKANLPDLEKLAPEQLAEVADNYRKFMGSRWGEAIEEVGTTANRASNLHGEHIEILRGNRPNGNIGQTQEIVTKILQEDMDLGMKKLMKADVKDMVGRLTAGALVGSATFLAQGGDALWRAAQESGDQDAWGNVLSQAMMAFIASSGHAWDRMNSYKYTGDTAQLGGERNPNELPGMSNQFVVRNRMRRQMHALGMHDADLMVGTTPMDYDQALGGAAKMHAHEQVRKLNTMINVLRDSDAATQAKVLDNIVVIDDISQKKDDGKQYVTLEEIRMTTRALHMFASHGADISDFLENGGADTPSKEAWWNSLKDDGFRGGPLEKQLAFTALKMREVMGNPDRPVTMDALVEADRKAFMEFNHNAGVAIEGAGQVMSEALARTDVMKEAGTKLRRITLVDAGARGAGDMDNARINSIASGHNKILDLMSITAAKHADIEGDPVVIDPRTETGMEALRTLEEQQNVFMEKVNKDLGLKDNQRFDLKNNDFINLVASSTDAHGENLARRMFVEQRHLVSGEGDFGLDYQGVLTEAQRIGLIERDTSSTSTPRYFVNDIDTTGMKYVDAQFARNFVGFLRQMNGFVPNNQKRIEGGRLFEKTSIIDPTVLDGSDPLIDHDRGLAGALRDVGMIFDDNYHMYAYQEGIQKANLSKLTDRGADLGQFFATNGYIKNDSRGRRMLYLPHVIWDDALRKLARDGDISQNAIADATFSDGIMDARFSGDETSPLRDLVAASEAALGRDMRGLEVGELGHALNDAQLGLIADVVKELKDAGVIDGVAMEAFQARPDGSKDDVLFLHGPEGERMVDDLVTALDAHVQAQTTEGVALMHQTLGQISQLLKSGKLSKVSQEKAGRFFHQLQGYLASGDKFGWRQAVHMLRAADIFVFSDAKRLTVNTEFTTEKLERLSDYIDERYDTDIVSMLYDQRRDLEPAAAAEAKAATALIPRAEKEGVTLDDVFKDFGVENKKESAIKVRAVMHDLIKNKIPNGMKRGEALDTVKGVIASVAHADKVNDANQMPDRQALALLLKSAAEASSTTIRFTGGETYVPMDELFNKAGEHGADKARFDETFDAGFEDVTAVENRNYRHDMKDRYGTSVHILDKIAGRRFGDEHQTNILLKSNRHLRNQILKRLWDGGNTFAGRTDDQTTPSDTTGLMDGRYVDVALGDLGIDLYRLPRQHEAAALKAALTTLADTYRTTTVFQGERWGDVGRGLDEYIEALGMLENGDVRGFNRWVNGSRGKLRGIYRFMAYDQMFSPKGMEKLRNSTHEEVVSKFVSRVHQLGGRGAQHLDPTLMKWASEMQAETDRAKLQGADRDLYRQHGLTSDGENLRIMVLPDDSDRLEGFGVTRTDGFTATAPWLPRAVSLGQGLDIVDGQYGAMKAMIRHRGENGALLAKTYMGVNMHAMDLIKQNNVAMVLSESAAKAMFGQDMVDLNGMTMREAADAARTGSAKAGKGVFEISFRDIAFQSTIHDKVDRGVVSWQAENGMSQGAVKAMRAYMGGRQNRSGNMASAVRALNAPTLEGRRALREFLALKNRWDDLGIGLGEGEDASFMEAYVMNSTWASPNDLGMGTAVKGYVKNYLLKQSVFKGHTENGGNSPLAPDMANVLDSGEGVLPYYMRDKVLNTQTLGDMRFGLNNKDMSPEQVTEMIGQEFGLDPLTNRYNQDTDRASTWSNHRLLAKGENGFLFKALMSGARNQVDMPLTAHLKELDGLSGEARKARAIEMNDQFVDLILERSRQDSDALGGKLTLGELYDRIGDILGTYDYASRSNGTETGKQHVGWGMTMIAQRSPSNRINDTMPMNMLGFGHRAQGNQLHLSYKDAVPIAEADFDKDSFNYWFDSPTELIGDAMRLRGAGKAVETIKEQDAIKKALGGEFELMPDVNGQQDTDEDDVYRYLEHQERSQGLRGQIVKAQRTILYGLQEEMGVSFKYGGKTYKVLPKGDMEHFIGEGTSLEKANQLVQTVLDSKKGMLPTDMFESSYNPMRVLVEEFFHVTDENGKPLTGGEANAMRDAYELIEIMLRPYAKVQGMMTGGFVGDASVTKKFDDIADDAIEWVNMTGDDRATVMRKRMRYMLQYTDGDNTVLDAINRGLDPENDAREDGSLQVLYGTHGRQKRHESMVDYAAQEVARIADAANVTSRNSWHAGTSAELSMYRLLDDSVSGMAQTRHDVDAQGLVRVRRFRGDVFDLHKKIQYLMHEYRNGDLGARHELNEARHQMENTINEELFPVQDPTKEGRPNSSLEEHQAEANYRAWLAVQIAKEYNHVEYSEVNSERKYQAEQIIKIRNTIMRGIMKQSTQRRVEPHQRVNMDMLDKVMDAYIGDYLNAHAEDPIGAMLDLVTPEQKGLWNYQGQLIGRYNKIPMDVLRSLKRVAQPSEMGEFMKLLAESSSAADRMSRGDMAGMAKLSNDIKKSRNREITTGMYAYAQRDQGFRGQQFNATIDRIFFNKAQEEAFSELQKDRQEMLYEDTFPDAPPVKRSERTKLLGSQNKFMRALFGRLDGGLPERHAVEISTMPRTERAIRLEQFPHIANMLRNDATLRGANLLSVNVEASVRLPNLRSSENLLKAKWFSDQKKLPFEQRKQLGFEEENEILEKANRRSRAIINDTVRAMRMLHANDAANGKLPRSHEVGNDPLVKAYESALEADNTKKNCP